MTALASGTGLHLSVGILTAMSKTHIALTPLAHCQQGTAGNLACMLNSTPSGHMHSVHKIHPDKAGPPSTSQHALQT